MKKRLRVFRERAERRWRHCGWTASKRGESGSHIVEFALVLMPLSLIVCGICQYGLIYAASMTVRNATVAAARYATLATGTTSPSIAQIQSVAQDALAPMITVTNNNVTVIVNTNATVGGVAGATSVQIRYNMPLAIPWVVLGANVSNGQLPLSATTIMR